MKKILLLSILLAGTAFANEEGGELHEESCVRCHDSGMYTRDNSKIQNHFDLRSQVSACANNLGTGWFPDEEKS